MIFQNFLRGVQLTRDQSLGLRDGTDDHAVVPLTAAQAQAWRAQYPQMKMPRAFLLPAATGFAVAALAWLMFNRDAGLSAAYGALAALLPAALAARGTLRWAAPGFVPGAALSGLLWWEGLKVALTALMLLAAPRVLETLNWPALLIGLALVLKVYWVGLISARRGKPVQGKARGN